MILEDCLEIITTTGYAWFLDNSPQVFSLYKYVGNNDSLGGASTFGLVLAFGHVPNWPLGSRAQLLHVVYEVSLKSLKSN